MQYSSTKFQQKHYNLHEDRIYCRTVGLVCISFECLSIVVAGVFTVLQPLSSLRQAFSVCHWEILENTN